MKQILSAFARYNRGANAALAAILAAQPAAILEDEQGSFYKTIHATFAHIVGAEVGWLRRYPTFFPCKALEGKALVTADIEDTRRRMDSDVRELVSISGEADGLFVSFVDDIEEKRLSERFKYKNYRGDEIDRPLWAFIFHVLNHGTHHRGEISALLDRKGVKNDYSGFTNYTT